MEIKKQELNYIIHDLIKVVQALKNLESHILSKPFKKILRDSEIKLVSIRQEILCAIEIKEDENE